MDLPLPTTPAKTPENAFPKSLTHSRFPREEKGKKQQTTTPRTHTFSEASIERQLGLNMPIHKPRRRWMPITQTLTYHPRQASSHVPPLSWHWKQRLDREKIGDDKGGGGEKGKGKSRTEDAKDSSTPELSPTSDLEYTYPPNPSQARTKSYTRTTQQPAPTLSSETYKQYIHLLERSEEAWWWYCYFSTPGSPFMDLSKAGTRDLSMFFTDDGDDESRTTPTSTESSESKSTPHTSDEEEDVAREGRDSWECGFCGGQCFWRCSPFTH